MTENGRYYYGARQYTPRPVIVSESPAPPTYDVEACEYINARRFFGFYDHEEIDVIVLRSRRCRKLEQAPAMRNVIDRWYGVLERINHPQSVKTLRQLLDEG